MTAQKPDTILFKGRKFHLFQIQGEGLVTPEQLGLQTFPLHSACWRGHIFGYKTRKGYLLLHNLLVSNTDNNIQTNLNGTWPRLEGTNLVKFKDVDMEVAFSGVFRIGKYWSGQLYTAWPGPENYRIVLDLHFQEGRLTATTDRSPDLAGKHSNPLEESEPLIIPSCLRKDPD